MRGFYVLLAVVAVGGAGWLIYAAQKKPAEAPAAVAPIPVANDGFKGYTLGSDSAPVEITVYSDFECPFCAAFASVQMPVVREQLIATGKLRLRFRDFPLSSHKYSRTAALAAQCAGEQGKFWEMHDQLFMRHDWAQSDKDPSDVFKGFASGLGIDMQKYQGCMDAQRYAGRVEASYEEGQARGVQGTPSLFVDGRHYEGKANSDDLNQLVDSIISARKRR